MREVTSSQTLFRLQCHPPTSEDDMNGPQIVVQKQKGVGDGLGD